MKLNRFLRSLVLAALAAGGADGARAAGTTPLALVQQFDNTGQPLTGCLVFFYVAGTVATPQQVFQDFALSQPAPNPMTCSGFRVPMHWLADGLIHVRLTDASGVVQLDSTLQVLGPSGGGGGGGGGTVDPTTVAATGDIKARLSSETLVGWVMLNGQTIGPPGSGANVAPSDGSTHALFNYLWQNCSDPHCPINGATGNRGATAEADWVDGHKAITLPDMRGRSFVGRDCMGAGCAGLLLSGNITSGGTDGVDTPAAGGGVANQTASTTLSQDNLPAVNFDVSVSGANHAHGVSNGTVAGTTTASSYASGGNITQLPIAAQTITINSSGALSMTGTAASGGKGSAATSQRFSNLGPFLLVTWYMRK
jgi:hypothetical protein